MQHIQVEIPRVTVPENSAFSLLARLVGKDNTLVTQADISSIAWQAVDLNDDTLFDSGTLTKTIVIFDTLQTDERWKPDSKGYNFLWVVPSTVFGTPEKTYRVGVKIVPTSGVADENWTLWDVTVLKIGNI